MATSEAVKPLGEGDKAISASTTWRIRMGLGELSRLFSIYPAPDATDVATLSIYQSSFFGSYPTLGLVANDR